jgi:hypothetical protein
LEKEACSLKFAVNADLPDILHLVQEEFGLPFSPSPSRFFLAYYMLVTMVDHWTGLNWKQTIAKGAACHARLSSDVFIAGEAKEEYLSKSERDR